MSMINKQIVQQKKLERQKDCISLPQYIYEWVQKHTNNVITGFEHKTNPEGKFLDQRGQLNQTQHQLLLIATDCLMRGKTTDETLRTLRYFIH